MNTQSIQTSRVQIKDFMKLYAQFITTTYGSRTWQMICNSRTGGKFIVELIQEYGKLAFHETVNITAKKTNQQVSSILISFHNFINS